MNILKLTREHILQLISKRDFYSSIPAFGPMLSQVEKTYNRMIAEKMITPDGELHPTGCKGCKKKQVRNIQDNMIDVFVNAIIQLQAKPEYSSQLIRLREYIAATIQPCDNVEIVYSGACTNKKETIISF